ncbi:hypothetical protein [Mucilaginibacter gotjawali]|uniref:Uncharacterized protein n=2 Tax=Mucilaginibacter gotjawali TaxID=1550579 RepID=A0A839SMZ5_9SPHI|nr:hypothetical protein [Mucilaginibacter gotjawali]MBB3057777.1 hypothetical protein [Mucilaginibacter gotjawali]BAU52579.1 hypothetical protein MgSA37_00741 [Mucilaginibacter gotjawali]
MSQAKKIRLIVPIIFILFLVAYASHKHEDRHSNIVGRLQTRDMDEISGIAASGINEDLYYVHNDSGDTSRFFAIYPSGELKSTVYFNGDPREKRYGVHDCEDIAVGPGPVQGKSYIYLGDIGDNDAERKYLVVYRMEEQKEWAGGKNYNTTATPVYLKYPDGPKDAETLMVDPVEKLIYIVSKRHDTVGVYTAPLIFRPDDTVTLTKRCKVFFPGIKPFKWITAGDISKDGQQVLIKSYNKVYYWKRDRDEPIWKTVQKPWKLLPYEEEKQGEGIGFTPDGKGYYTCSEGVYTPIYYYRIP